MIFQDNHDPSWIPDMHGPFADELAAYIRHKRALGFGYTEPTCRLFSRNARCERVEARPHAGALQRAHSSEAADGVASAEVAAPAIPAAPVAASAS